MEEQWSTCCGAEASYLSEDLCGECGEHAVFQDEDGGDEEPRGDFVEWTTTTTEPYYIGA